MIFYYQGKKNLFIHVPKTGGNTIQTAFIEHKITDDFKTQVMNNQDGIDRFDISGPETQCKHQSLHNYLTQNPYMISLDVFSAVRKPFERLISFYFAPFFHARHDQVSGRFIFPKTVVFNERKFLTLVQNTRTAAEWLSTSKKNIQMPDNIKIIKTEDLDNQFKLHFPDIPISRRMNCSPYKSEAETVKKSIELRNYVENSKHSIDYSLFY